MSNHGGLLWFKMHSQYTFLEKLMITIVIAVKKASDLSELRYEAKSSKDNAW